MRPSEIITATLIGAFALLVALACVGLYVGLVAETVDAYQKRNWGLANSCAVTLALVTLIVGAAILAAFGQ